MKNSEPHTIRISMVWPKSGSITSSDTSSSSSISAIDVAGISGRRADSANSHAAITTNAGLAEFGSLDIDADQGDPAPRALDLGTEQQCRHDQHDRDREYDQRGAAYLPRRQERHPDHHDDGRQQKQHMAVEEVERIEPDPCRHRRAGRQRKNDAGQHQRDDRRELQAVDGPPPFAEAGCVVHGRSSAFPRAEVCSLVAHDGLGKVNGTVL